MSFEGFFNNTLFRIVLLSIVLIQLSYAQKINRYTVEGVIVDENKEGLPEVSIYVNDQDKVESFTFSNRTGNFQLEGKTFKDSITIFFSYMSYELLEKRISVTQNKLDTIRMVPETNVLNEVIIKSLAPVSIRQDTIEFRASAFKTQINANVEDLLKKIPGITVSTSGKIQVNGKPITQILVDGEPFFGHDYRIVTKNIQKDMVDKVELTSTKTKKEAFLGEEGDKEHKTINVKLKKDKKRDFFGSLSAGMGNENKYEAGSFLSLFSGQKRLGITASANTINVKEALSGVLFPETDHGIDDFKNIGLNYNDKLNKSTRLNAEYHFKTNQNTFIRDGLKQVFTDDGFFNNKKSQYNLLNSREHNFSTVLSWNSKEMIADLSVYGNFDNSEANYLTGILTKNSQSDLQQNYKEKALQNNQTKDVTVKTFWTYKLKPKGMSLSLDLKVNPNQSTDYNLQYQTIHSQLSDSLSNQQIDSKNKHFNIESIVSFRFNLLKKNWLLIDYNFSETDKSIDHVVYDKDSQTGIDFLNKHYDRIQRHQALQLNYSVFYGDKNMFNFRLAYNLSKQNHTDYLRPYVNSNQLYKYPTLSVSNSYYIKGFLPNSSVNISYDMKTILPTIGQRTAFNDYQNPFYIILGNPDLKPFIQHDFNISIGSSELPFGMGNSTRLSLTGQLAKGNISPKTDLDNNSVQYNSFVNIDDLMPNFGVSLTTIYALLQRKKLQIDLNTSLSYNLAYDKFYFNERLLTQQTHHYNLDSQLHLTYLEKLYLTLGYQYLYNTVDDHTRLNLFKRNSHHIDTELKLSPFKNLNFNNKFLYTYNRSISSAFNPSSLLWSADVNYTFFKDKLTTYIKLYDVLGSRNRSYQSVNQQYIETYETNMLGRFYIIGLQWKFNAQKS